MYIFWISFQLNSHVNDGQPMVMASSKKKIEKKQEHNSELLTTADGFYLKLFLTCELSFS